jgi:hypothetical protein
MLADLAFADLGDRVRGCRVELEAAERFPVPLDRDAARPLGAAAVRRVATAAQPRHAPEVAVGSHPSAHLAGARVGVLADKEVLLTEAFQAEVMVVDVGVSALPIDYQVSHEVAD